MRKDTWKMKLTHARKLKGVRYDKKVYREAFKVIVLPADDPRVIAAIEFTMTKFKGAWEALANR
jgi:hypothetical protein